MSKNSIPLLVALAGLALLIPGLDRERASASAPESLKANPAAGVVLELDGTGDYVEVPHDAALNPTGSFTLEAWVWRDDDSRCETIISKGYQTAYWLGFCSNRIRFYPAGSGTNEDGSTDIPDSMWTHIAVVFESGGRKYYINGELDYTGGAEPTPTTNTLPVRIGSDRAGCCDFDGQISNVRLWNVARTQDEIRRTMHEALEGPLPGLVANWRFDGDYADNIGGFDGTGVGEASLAWATRPAHPASAAVLDQNFNSLSSSRYEAATAYVPYLDQVMLIGGVGNGSFKENDIDAVDLGTGELTSLGSLPVYLTEATATYAPSTDMVYVFGGRTSGGRKDTIYAVDPPSGTVRTITATLPQPTVVLAAAYHPGQDKVYLFGGYSDGGALDTISVFDPSTEAITTAVGFTLTEALYGTAAAYSAATDRIYLFGGYGPGSRTDTIYEIALNDGGVSGDVNQLAAQLPERTYGLRAIVDPATQLIYLMGSSYQDWIWVFDPTTAAVWRTRIPQPELYAPSVALSAPNRHALIIGGSSSDNHRNVWRFPVGDGPLLPLGRWDFPLPVTATINTIDVDRDGAIVATSGDGAWLYWANDGRYHYSPAILGSASGIVNDGSYSYLNPTSAVVRLATNDAGAIRDDGTTFSTYYSSTFGTDQVLSVSSGGQVGFYGTGGSGLWWFHYNPATTWTWDFTSQSIRAMAYTIPGDLGGEIYVLTADGNLRRLQYERVFGTSAEADYGQPCSLLSPSDLAIGQNRDWWIVSPGDPEFGGNGICRIPAAASPGAGATVSVDAALGNIANRVDVDGDGRVWVSMAENGTDGSGGLAIFEVSSGSTSVVRTSEYNWLNAPIGSDTAVVTDTGIYWDSTLTAVGAGDERVWLGTEDGRLITLAQRWQQIDDGNDMGDKAVTGVWTVRGRTFMATTNSLHVLMPDGLTWDNRSTSRVWDVLGDRQGRIWVATNTGIRLYTSTGWDFLTDREGPRPNTAVYALAEDQAGRIWIGGSSGLTLFDRERFVARFTAANSDLPGTSIRTLFVDRGNRLWAGTAFNGLARLDGATWTTFTTADGLPSNLMHDLDQTGIGDLAVSTSGGLALYDGSSFISQTLPIADADLPLSVDESGRLWAGNVVLIDDEWQVYYEASSGLASTEIYDSASDGADHMWFAHSPDSGVSVRGSYLPALADTVPVISDVVPISGTAGDEIVISGSGFGNSRRDVTVSIGQARAEVLRASHTEIRVRLTDQNTSGDVSITVGGRRSILAGGFCAVPVIESFTPSGGNDGVRVHIRGQNFDPASDILLGGVTERAPHVTGATHLWFDIRPGDTNGPVSVVNHCGHTATSGDEFRRITLNLERIVLNQGIQSMGLVADRPTLAQLYLSHSIEPRDTDRLEVDYVELTFDEPGQLQFVHRLRIANPDSDGDGFSDAPSLFTLDGPPDDAELADIANSFNVVVTPDLLGGMPPADSPVQVGAGLRRNGLAIAQGDGSFGFRRDLPLRVLLVPILENGDRHDPAALLELGLETNRGLGDLRQRIFPTGRVELYWSPLVYELNDVIITNESQTNVGDTLTLYDASHEIDYARRVWNIRRDPDIMLSFGVLDPDLNTNTGTIGQAFWPDTAQLLNSVLLDSLDAVCDVGAFIVHLFSFGAVTDDSCSLEVPLYVGWGVSTGNSSDLIGHEMGHMLGLVKPWAPNGDAEDNFSHSVIDEIDPGTCSNLLAYGSSSAYNIDKTLYRQPGVSEPVVNPLWVSGATDVQIRGQLTTTWSWTGTDPTTYTVNSEALVPRAKAIMSYACSAGNSNVFYEPVDMPSIFAEYYFAPARGIINGLAWASLPSATVTRQATASSITPIPVIGDRLYVSGQIDRAADTGELRRVVIIGEDGPVDTSYDSGYWLVQLDGGSNELGRTGVFPVFSTSAAMTDTGFFAATLLAEENLAQIQLLHDASVLDTFTAGSNPPTVTLSSPTGGSYSSGVISATWSASDVDGDSLEITLLYSADSGVTWTPVGISNDLTGTIAIPVAVLAGGSQAHIMVVASDGFRSAEAMSPAFTVTAQPPLPFIDSPAHGSSILEGRVVTLIGGANDNQDLFVDSANLQWYSDRDGDLGVGTPLDLLLSVGMHVISLTATNSASISTTASVAITVVADYDYDGIPDADELAEGLNLLTVVDAYSDADDDGLTLLVERNRGLNPGNEDSDGDGRLDGDEIADGTDPLTADAPLPPDSLSAYPDSLVFDADLSRNTAVPQALVQLLSREPVTWTLSADANWLASIRDEGQTPGSTLIVVDTYAIPNDGTYTGTLFFDSALGRATVPVTATLINVPERVYLPLVLR